MYCAKCGAEYKQGDKFCAKCGAGLQDEFIETKPNIIIKTYDNIQEIKPQDHKKFNFRIAIGVVIVLVLIASINLGYNSRSNDSATKVDKTIQSNVGKAEDKKDDTSTEKAQTVAETPTQVEPKTVPTEIPKPSSTTITDQNWELAKKDFEKLGAVLKEGENGGTYNPKEIVSINRSLLTTVEGFRTSIDNESYAQGKYYLIVDFTILNISTTNYSNSSSQFTLNDNLGYTYDPTMIASTNGSLDGDITAKGERRGEIAFAVLDSQRQFILHYNTNAGMSTLKSLTGDNETINYKIDINTLIKKQQDQQNNSNNAMGG